MDLTHKEIEYILDRNSEILISEENKNLFDSKKKRNEVMNGWVFGGGRTFFGERGKVFKKIIKDMKETNKPGDNDRS